MAWTGGVTLSLDVHEGSAVRMALIEDEAQMQRLLSGVLLSGGYEPEVWASGTEFLPS